MCRIGRKAGGTGIFWVDDSYIIGPSDVNFLALVTSERRLQEECQLVLKETRQRC